MWKGVYNGWTAQSSARGKGQMECVWGVFSCQGDSDSQWEAVGNKTKKPKTANKWNKQTQMSLRLCVPDWQGEKTEVREANRGSLCWRGQFTGFRERRGENQRWSWGVKLGCLGTLVGTEVRRVDWFNKNGMMMSSESPGCVWGNSTLLRWWGGRGGPWEPDLEATRVLRTRTRDFRIVSSKVIAEALRMDESPRKTVSSEKDTLLGVTV